MRIKASTESAGYFGVLYDADDPSAKVVWRCDHVPPHSGKAEARACANEKLARLRRKK